MLEAIRNNAQSWGVKLLFAIIVLVFVFWGVGSFRNSERRVVASVGDQEIGLQDFAQAYQRQVETLRRQYGDISSQDLQNMDLKRQVLEQMINERLIQSKAEELGLFVGSGQVRTRITAMSVFHGDNATFDPQLYQNLLRVNNLSPAQFEDDIRMSLLSSALREVVTSPIRVDEAEAREWFNYVQAKTTVDYVWFPVQEYTDDVQLTDEEVSEYFETHKEDYRIPAKMAMQALLITPKTLASNQEVDADEIERYYQNNKQEFTRPEQVQARHILVRVSQDASDQELEKAREKIESAAKRLKQGDDFAQVAKEVSEGPSAEQGGDMGWFGRNSMVQEFEETAFAMEPGEISEPVRTQFGFHLIKVYDRREAGVQPLDQVQEEIQSRLARDKARDTLEDTLDEVLQIVLTSGDLQQAAEAVHVEVQEFGPFSAANPPSQLALDQEQVQKIIQMQEGELTETPILLDDGYLVFKKTSHESAHIPPLDQVQEQVISALEQDKANDLARKAAEDVLAKLDQGESPSGLGVEIETSEQFTRQGFIPGLGRNQELAKKAFAAQKGSWLEKPYPMQGGWIIAARGDKTSPEESAWERQKEQWMKNVHRMQEQRLFQAYLEGLRESVEVSIKAPKALEYS
jgi:peptidyl-prolyl cis-trans isomerase D